MMSEFDTSFILVNVYGPTSTQDKLRVWDNLTHMIQLQDSQNIILGGDFKVFFCHLEKKRGIVQP